MAQRWWMVGGVPMGLLLALGLWWGLPSSEGQTPAPDGSYWQAQAETLFQSRQACEQVQIQLRLQLAETRAQLETAQQRLTAVEDVKLAPTNPLPTP